MNIKKLSILLMVLVSSIFIASCGSGRDLSKTSTRLIGHWGYFFESEEIEDPELIEAMKEPMMEMYFGEPDDDSVGSVTLISGGDTIYAQYRVLSETDETVTIGLFVEPDPTTMSQTYWVAEDGMTMKDIEYDGLIYQYIDSKANP